MPLMSQEKMSMKSTSGEYVEVFEGGCVILVGREILRLLAPGGLISQPIFSFLWLVVYVLVMRVGHNRKSAMMTS